MEKENYLILSLKHSPWGDSAVWWGPNNCGYTSHLETAGLYSEDQVFEAPSYYNNGQSTVAIKYSDAKKYAVTTVDFCNARELSKMRNNL